MARVTRSHFGAWGTGKQPGRAGRAGTWVGLGTEVKGCVCLQELGRAAPVFL